MICTDSCCISHSLPCVYDIVYALLYDIAYDLHGLLLHLTLFALCIWHSICSAIWHSIWSARTLAATHTLCPVYMTYVNDAYIEILTRIRHICTWCAHLDTYSHIYVWCARIRMMRTFRYVYAYVCASRTLSPNKWPKMFSHYYRMCSLTTIECVLSLL